MTTDQVNPSTSNDSKKPTPLRNHRLLPMELKRRRREAKARLEKEEQTSNKHEKLQENQSTPRNNNVRCPDAKGDYADTPKIMLEVSSQSVTTTSTPTTSRMNNVYGFSSSLFESGRKRQKKYLHPGTMLPSSIKLGRSIPLDMSIKSKMVILTSFPFPFIRQKSSLKAKVMHELMATSTTGGVIQRSLDGKKTNEEMWHEGLHYFAYPADMLPPGLKDPLKVNSSLSEADNSFYIDRFHSWQESFRDAYMVFRRLGNCYFYLRSSEYVACFFEEDASSFDSSIANMIRKQTDKCIKKQEIKCDRPRLRAALTQSNSRIRNELLSSRVTFTCPFDEKASVEREVDDFQALQELVALDNEENQMQTDVSFLSHQKKLTGPDSLLLFEEHDAVHGLFDFLFNRKPLSNQDVAEIIAPFPFSDASIKKLVMMYSGKIASANDDPSVPEGDKPTEMASVSSKAANYRLELSGICMPSSLFKIVQALQRECAYQDQEENNSTLLATDVDQPRKTHHFQILMQCLPLTERINALFFQKQEKTEQQEVEKEILKRRIGDILWRKNQETQEEKEEELDMFEIILHSKSS